MNCFKFSAESPIGHPETRLQAVGMYAGVVSRISPPHGLEAYQLAINLIPELIWLGTTIDTRYKGMPLVSHVVREAVTAAFNSKDFVMALKWLEQGRSVVWNQMLQLRSPFDDLGIHHPELAEKLKRVAANLYSTNSSSTSPAMESSTSTPYSLSPEQAALKHWSLATEYERLLSEARIIPGFETFMLPQAQNSDEFFRAAESGPIVVIHAHNSRCDALALLPGDPDVRHITLPNMSYEIAQTASLQIKNSLRLRGVHERCHSRGAKPVGQKDYFKPVLVTLWVDVVKPILEALGLTSHSTKDLPHITWCTTGPFSLLPIHAAGYYDRPMAKLSDYAISSYTPTLTALLLVGQKDSRPLSSVLCVGQEATPNQSPLPQTVEELDRIGSRALESQTEYVQLDKNSATISNVLEAMKNHSCVHLACHAYQNLVNPAESGFHLHDGTLTLRTIMQQSFHGKQLAFLSACQTAAGDDQIPDEAVHLASGMLMAGYPSVIATLWSISDYFAPLVADEVYARLMTRGTFKPGDTAKALHHAVTKLREEVGDDDFIRWVPYVHFGI